MYDVFPCPATQRPPQATHVYVPQLARPTQTTIMKQATILGLIGLTFALTSCGGRDDDSKRNGSGTTGGGDAGGAAGSNIAGGAVSNGGATAGSTVVRTCTVPDDCVLQSVSCCASCGTLNPSDYTAMNRSAQYDFQRSVCAGNSSCEACLAQVGNSTLLATCEQGQCIVIDLLEHAVTACSNASECYVRAPECCECGGSTNEFAVVALSSASSVAYSTLVCSSTQVCADCAPVYPTVNVACIAGHCRAVP